MTKSPRTLSPGAKPFVERHDLWSAEQRRAFADIERRIKRDGIERIRFAFCDQHGTLRGKTLVAAEAVRAMRAGIAMTSTLLAKDTSHRNVFAVFAEGGGIGLPEMAGAGNIVMAPDPATFRLLPWTGGDGGAPSGWMLCDLFFDNGKPVPLSTRARYQRALEALATQGFDFCAGLEVEFQLLRIVDPRLAPETLTWPPEPPAVEHTTHGFQYLTESRFDQVEPILETFGVTMQQLGLPLASLEVELGPSQYEFTFAPQVGLAAADAMVLFRSALKQVARRHGFIASLMCRPKLPHAMASGWHLHQSLLDRRNGKNLFVSSNDALLSPLAQHYLAGILTHARAAASFSTPTINGYKRYHGVNTMAPIQAVWARDNRGVMVRALGRAGDPATHLENRVGEPLANPYLYMASQIHAGLDGIARKLDAPPSADAPYERTAEPLPASLAEALDALDGSACTRAGFGDAFVDYWLRLKRAELARCERESADQPARADEVSAWEHREYFDLA